MRNVKEDCVVIIDTKAKLEEPPTVDPITEGKESTKEET